MLKSQEKANAQVRALKCVYVARACDPNSLKEL